jgi:hypothetical protein
MTLKEALYLLKTQVQNNKQNMEAFSIIENVVIKNDEIISNWYISKYAKPFKKVKK